MYQKTNIKQPHKKKNMNTTEEKQPYKVVPEEYHCKTWFCKVWNHWSNPLGNWNEPTPYPEKRKVQADEAKLPNELWWALRNPFHNLNHYVLGIVPKGERYEWYKPEDNGWERVTKEDSIVSWWKKEGRIPLPYILINGAWTFYIGWMSRGNFGIALRKNSD